jgi:cell wall-associated NlpC family hydrolase
MTRWRLAGVVLAGILLGFFLGLAAVTLGTSVPRDHVTAAAVPQSTARTASYGARQARLHPAGYSKPYVVVFIRTLQVGMKGCKCPTVFQLQRALKAAKVRPAGAKATGFYGTATRDQVKAFQRKVHLSASGVYGPATNLKLWRYYDQAARGRLTQVAKSRTVITFRHRIVHAASVAWSHRGLMRYSQSASRGLLPPLPGFPRATDCSGYATWLFKVSGLADPSGFNYRITGYTGTLATHGVRVSANGPLQPGDLVFYGGGWPYGHVAIVVDGFRRLVSSHGSPGIKVVPFNYRPVSVVRRYF